METIFNEKNSFKKSSQDAGQQFKKTPFPKLGQDLKEAPWETFEGPWLSILAQASLLTTKDNIVSVTIAINSYNLKVQPDYLQACVYSASFQKH